MDSWPSGRGTVSAFVEGRALPCPGCAPASPLHHRVQGEAGWGPRGRQDLPLPVLSLGGGRSLSAGRRCSQLASRRRIWQRTQAIWLMASLLTSPGMTPPQPTFYLWPSHPHQTAGGSRPATTPSPALPLPGMPFTHNLLQTLGSSRALCFLLLSGVPAWAEIAH